VKELFGFIISVRDIFNLHPVFGVGILLVGSFFFGKLFEKIHLPAITGFIFAGILFGPSITGIVHIEVSESFASITEVALAIIAFVIGSEFNISKLRRVGKSVIIITIFQLFATFAIVTFFLTLLGLNLAVAAILGAISSATAPAATVAVVRECKARGSFVDHLYGVVALDDAGCIILFGAIFSFASTALGGAYITIGENMLHACGEIFFSLLAGAIAGFCIHLITRKIERNNELLIISLGIVLLLTAVATSLHLSPLLASMTAGMVLTNISRKTLRILTILEGLSPPLYAAFFAIAGTELKLEKFGSWQILLLGGIYVVARAVGKYGGCFLGAYISGSDNRIRNYLGFAMLPQAGVAIGLVYFVKAAPFFQQAVPSIQGLVEIMVNIVLFSVFINELAGPPISKMAVVRGATL